MMVEQEKQRISVKLNGKEHSFHQIEKTKNAQPAEPSPLNEPIRPKSPEPPPLKPDFELKEEKRTERIEEQQAEKVEDTPSYFTSNIIDFNQMKEERETREQPYWDDGNRKWVPKLPPNNRKKKAGDRLKNTFSGLPISLIIAGVSAIIVGVGFGFMVLTAFTGDAERNTAASLVPPTEAVETMANGQASAVTLPDLSVEIVQGGAFSSSEKGNEIVSSIKSRGQAAVLKTNGDPMLMFIGLGLQKEEAGRLSQIYQQHGQDTYVKPFAVNGSMQSIESEAVKEFFAQGGLMFNDLARFSIAGLSGQSYALENIDTFLEQYEKWSNQGSTVIAELPTEAQGHAEQFLSSMAGAATQIEAYKGEQQEANLWGIQQHLLEALLAYDAFVQTIK
ncbi:hypothetical protein [Alkalihalobacterium chitinilyticum]|uniref:SPOR domain-containing protein n=1 Tax=Alkalihalobacterium chitinilyticum TaxID=2980103 RepID=A0ABT5VAR8_9BACI|nr:hypothetical protein [Alkalihalobacterium chitinilyticum]MDE5412442.1 hypothetical protein [Alkalihalobacterium chitinilyticum]